MSAITASELSAYLTMLVPVTVTLVGVLLPWPSRTSLRCIGAILVGWLAFFLLTMYCYNPAGIAAGYEQGHHFPEASYDNNTTSIALFFGWVVPVATASGYFALRAVWRHLRGYVV